jgi:hypothetical protein
MGDAVPSPSYQTHGPGPEIDTDFKIRDHTEDVRKALAYLDNQGGGTLLFPCVRPTNPWYPSLKWPRAEYYISDTITIPSNVTLQGEGAEVGGICRIFWVDVKYDYKDPEGCNESPDDLKDKPMFQIPGATSRVRFKDLAISSLTAGGNCMPIQDEEQIESDGTSAIEMNTDVLGRTGDIKDVIFENVSIMNFTYGIKAVNTYALFERHISNIKIRGYRPVSNHRQLYIDALYAHNWDVQNMNITSMMFEQGGVEIVHAGRPGGFTGENGGLKFLQLSCDGNFQRETTPPAFCVQVQKHSGLYFNQLHYEGVDDAIHVEDISVSPFETTNTDPIVMESSAASGVFKDASMDLYLIGNAIPAAPEEGDPSTDQGRMNFRDDGVNATVVDCGDLFTDLTDIPEEPTDDPDTIVPGMLFSHSERNRSTSLFAKVGSDPSYAMPHTVCPANINEVGGRLFDNGVLPTEVGTYSQEINSSLWSSKCSGLTVAECIEHLLTLGGTVYISSSLDVERAIVVPRGAQIMGAPGIDLTLDTDNDALFRIMLPTGTTDPFGMSGVILRNLTLNTTESGTTGIEMIGDTVDNFGISRDMHFSGLTIEGFDKGIYAHASPETPPDPIWYPMINGVSLKNMTFINNKKALDLFSPSASNWNVMNLTMKSTSNLAVGWNQFWGGHFSVQGARCEGGVTYDMSSCFNVQMVSRFSLTGLKKTVDVTNSVTIAPSYFGFDGVYHARQPSTVSFRNNDFTGGRINVNGKSFILSMNNKYDDVNVQITYQPPSYIDPWDDEPGASRLTYCGDSFTGSPHYAELSDYHPNTWVGSQTPTRIACSSDPIPWDEVVTWGGVDNDVPLVGNFYDEDTEDYVIFRPSITYPEFQIRARDGSAKRAFRWGLSTDTPLTAKFLPTSTLSQAVVFRSGTWYVLDTSDCTNDNDSSTCPYYGYSWGTTGDIPLVGNFTNDSDPLDDLAIYRPSTKTFWVVNPRTYSYTARTTSPATTSQLQAGDFLGKGYDQIAQFDAGNWYIINTTNGNTDTATLGAAGDKAVAGKYLPTAAGKDPCVQLGVWDPDDQKFYIRDVNGSTTDCGTRTANMYWGSNNNYGGENGDNDIPLTITDDGTIRRPAAYRPNKGVYEYGISNGQWWVHDKF